MKEAELSLAIALSTIDDCLKREAQSIATYIKSRKNLPKESLFDIFGEADIKDMSIVFNKEDRKCSGIYIFVVTDDVNIDKENFNSTQYASPLKEGNVNSFNKGDILYLGKSENDIKSRVNQHICNKTKTTYSLRLNAEYRKCLYGKIKVYAFVLKSDYTKYNKVMVPAVEVWLHEMLNPKVGTKRS